MNEKEIKLLFSFTDDIGETATLEKTFNDYNEIGTLPWLLEEFKYFLHLGKGIVYKDSLKAVEIHHIYEVVDNPTIEYLEKDLGFKGYSELVFDREQELKNMMLKK